MTWQFYHHDLLVKSPEAARILPRAAPAAAVKTDSTSREFPLKILSVDKLTVLPMCAVWVGTGGLKRTLRNPPSSYGRGSCPVTLNHAVGS